MTNQFTAIWDVLYGGFVIASLVMIWLAFSPPAFYRRWIQNSAPATTAAEG
jgi:hypothetical protein